MHVAAGQGQRAGKRIGRALLQQHVQRAVDQGQQHDVDGAEDGGVVGGHARAGFGDFVHGSNEGNIPRDICINRLSCISDFTKLEWAHR
jgi:hypothetical protein